MQWYVRRGGNQSGPIDDVALRQMAAHGEINTETLLWCPGAEGWRKAIEIPGLITPPDLPGDTIAPVRTAADAVSLPANLQSEAIVAQLARPWPRYWARSFDVFLWTILLAIIFAAVSPKAFDAVSGEGKGQVLSVLLLPFAMLLDAIIYSALQNTPGKWLSGIRVLSIRGEQVPFRQYLIRNFKVYLRGLGAGIGIVALFTLLSSYRKADKNQLISWDTELETRAFQLRSGWWRPYTVAILYLATFAGLTYLGLRQSDPSPEQQLRDDIAASNKGLPKMIDEDTRFDRVEALPGLAVQYDYTLTKLEAASLDKQLLDSQLQGDMRTNVKTSLCSSADLKKFRDMGSTFQYQYRDKNGEILGVIRILSSECAAGKL